MKKEQKYTIRCATRGRNTRQTNLVHRNPALPVSYEVAKAEAEELTNERQKWRVITWQEYLEYVNTKEIKSIYEREVQNA